MIINVLLIIMFLMWLYAYYKNNFLVLTLPYFMLIFVLPFYNILDEYVFLKLFGCACVPRLQSNYFNIGFNANDLRQLIFNLLAFVSLGIGIYLSRKCTNKRVRRLYLFGIIFINILLAYMICKIYYWA